MFDFGPSNRKQKRFHVAILYHGLGVGSIEYTVHVNDSTFHAGTHVQLTLQCYPNRIQLLPNLAFYAKLEIQ